MLNARILDKNRQSMDSTFLYGEEMKEIPLFHGRGIAFVDDDVFEYLCQFRWCSDKDGYVYRSENGKTIYMHREIMNPPKNRQIDHINRCVWDNVRSNLRICTKSENQGNQPLAKNNTSGYRGVTYSKRDRKWKAKIKIFMKIKNLGDFKSPEEAAHAYDRAAKNHFGEFAWVNFPEEWVNRDKEYD